MGANSKLAIPLYVGDPAGHAGCSFAAGMPVANLFDGAPGTPARIESIDPLSTYFREKFGLPGVGATQPLPAGFVALVKDNLTADDGTGRGARVRFVLDGSGTIPNPTRMLPTAESGNTFDAGDYTDIDDSPFSPGSDFMQNTTSGEEEVLLTFGAAHSDFLPGVDGMMVLAAVDTEEAFDYIEFDLYEGDNFIATLTTIEQIDNEVDALSGGEDPRLFMAFFDASQLSSATATPQIKVRLQGYLARLKAISIDPTVVTGGADSDSGWIIAHPDVTDAIFGDLPATWVGNVESRNVFHWPAGDVSGIVYWQVQIRDPFNVDGSIDIGELGAGPRCEFRINRDKGKLFDLLDTGSKTRTLGGQFVGVTGTRPRVIPIPLSWLSRQEGAALLQRIRRTPTLANVAVSLASESAEEAELLSCYGTLSVTQEYNAPHGLIRGTVIVIEEEF